VFRRWAIVIVVRPSTSRSIASRIVASVATSTEDVGSSRTSTGASLRKERAGEIRWRSPPESRMPRSPTIVSYPAGSASMKSWAPAARAASTISLVVAVGRA
jgi:hypothetical protein